MSQPEPDAQPEKPLFDDLQQRYAQVVFSRALSRTKHRQRAEDATQEAFTRAFRYYEGFDGRHPRAWLFRILDNHLNDRYAADGRDWLELIRKLPTATEWSGSDGVLEDVDGTSNADDELELRAMVTVALAALPAEIQAVLGLVVHEDRTLEETAELLGLDVASVRKLRSEGLRLLRHALGEQLAPLPSAVEGPSAPLSPMVITLLEFIAKEGPGHFGCSQRDCIDAPAGRCLVGGATRLEPTMLVALDVFVRTRSWSGDPKPTPKLFGEFRARLGAHLLGRESPETAGFAEDLAAMDLGTSLNRLCLLLTARALDARLRYPDMIHAGGQEANHAQYRRRATYAALWLLAQGEASVSRDD